MNTAPNTPNSRDQELLSAYLDGELTERERRQLEQRLAADDHLRAELNSLRQTVQLVRGLPLLKAPRDFTLDPALYAVRSPWWRRTLASPMTLQWSGALAAAASVILITLALFSRTDSQPSATMRGAAPDAEVALQVTGELGEPDPTMMDATLTETSVLETAADLAAPQEREASTAIYGTTGQDQVGISASPQANTMPTDALLPEQAGAPAPGGAADANEPPPVAEYSSSAADTGQSAAFAAESQPAESAPPAAAIMAQQAPSAPDSGDGSAALQDDSDQLQMEGEAASRPNSEETALPEEPMLGAVQGTTTHLAPTPTGVAVANSADEQQAVEKDAPQTTESESRNTQPAWAQWALFIGIVALVCSLGLWFAGWKKAHQ